MGLVLTRSVGQAVVIGDPLKPFGTVTLMRIEGCRVRLRFDFDGIEVNRSEVAVQKIDAAGHTPHDSKFATDRNGCGILVGDGVRIDGIVFKVVKIVDQAPPEAAFADARNVELVAALPMAAEPIHIVRATA